MACATVVAADLFRAADRSRDAYAMVVRQTLSVRAEWALARARAMPPGDERTEAMQEVTILENAAEMFGHLGGKGARGLAPASGSSASRSKPGK